MEGARKRRNGRGRVLFSDTVAGLEILFMLLYLAAVFWSRRCGIVCSSSSEQRVLCAVRSFGSVMLAVYFTLMRVRVVDMPDWLGGRSPCSRSEALCSEYLNVLSNLKFEYSVS